VKAKGSEKEKDGKQEVMLPYRYWLQIEDEQGSSIVGLLVGLSTQPCRKSTNQL